MKSNAWQNEIEEIIKLKEHFAITNQGLLKEIDSLLSAQDEVVTLLYSRRALEVIITEIVTEKLSRDRGTEPLNSLIDKLYKEKILPEYIQTSMQNLNRISTFGAHPKEFDPRQVRTILIELVTILDWYFKEKNYQPAGARKEEPRTITAEKIIPKPAKQDKQGKAESEGGKKSMTAVAAIIASAIAVAAIVVAVIIYFMRTSDDQLLSNTPAIEKTEVKQKINDTKSSISDTTTKNEIKTPVVSINTTVPTERPSVTPKTIAKEAVSDKKNEGISQKPAYTFSNKNDDIESLIQKVIDKKLPFTERQKISTQIKAMCEKNAVVSIFSEDVLVERKNIEEYLNALIILNYQQVNIKNITRNGSNKISVLEVIEKK